MLTALFVVAVGSGCTVLGYFVGAYERRESQGVAYIPYCPRCSQDGRHV